MTGDAVTPEAPVTETPNANGQQPANGQTDQQQDAQAKTTDASWLQELDKLDSKALRSHPRIAGIIGGEISKAIERERKNIHAEMGARASKDAEERLRKLAQDDPDTFAQQWLTDSQKHDIQQQLQDIRGSTRVEFAKAIGSAVTELPEWQHLNDADQEEMAKELLGKADDDVLPIYVRKVIDLMADKRSITKLEKWKANELAKERDAIRKELSAQMLQQGDAPDLTKSKSKSENTNIDVNSMSQAEFDTYWEKLKMTR